MCFGNPSGGQYWLFTVDSKVTWKKSKKKGLVKREILKTGNKVQVVD